MSSKSWFLLEPNKTGSLRLYCFAHAGGTSAMYLPWRNQLGIGIEVCPVQLPGRGSRFMEPSLESITELVSEITEALSKEMCGPFVFFGHSMGALVAFEVCRRLQALGRLMPELLIVSGCNSPQHLSPTKDLSNMLDDELIAELYNYNGTPREVLSDTGLMSLLLPAIRSDFSVIENYHYKPSSPLMIPITAFAGKADFPRITDVAKWQDETLAEFRLYWFDGDHFFVQSQSNNVLLRIKDEVSNFTICRS